MARNRPSPHAVGIAVGRIRNAAGLTQAQVAKKTRFSAATVSRVESGDVELPREDLSDLLDAIGTDEAKAFMVYFDQSWEHLSRPDFHHPDRETLWQAEQLLQKTAALKSGALTEFVKRVEIHEEEIKDAAEFLQDVFHEIVVIGGIGVGKTTAICSISGLCLADDIRRTALETGGGGTTLCEVQIESGERCGFVVEPRSEEALRQDVADFAEYLTAGQNQMTIDESDAIGVSREVERAIRNMAGLSTVKGLDEGGKRTRMDPARKLAEEVGHADDLTMEILAKMGLRRRYERSIWFPNESGQDELSWIQETFAAINNGRRLTVSIPDRIQLTVSTAVLSDDYPKLRIIDTKGIDNTPDRPDIIRHFDNPRTLLVLCSEFKSAPAFIVRTLLRKAREIGVQDIVDRTLLLVLVEPGEALEVKDHSGEAAVDDAEGYEIKAEQIKLPIPVAFFNALSERPDATRRRILELVKSIRRRKSDRIDQLSDTVERLQHYRKQEETQAVLDAAMRHILIWLNKNNSVGKVGPELHRPLVVAIDWVHPRSVWASTRRKGKWYNLDFYHHIGQGARMMAVVRLRPRVEGLEAIVDNLLSNDDFSVAHDFLEQIVSTIRRKFGKLQERVEVVARTKVEHLLVDDSEFWKKCRRRWGLGVGYRDDIVGYCEDWFGDSERMEVQKRINHRIETEWHDIVEAVRRLIEEVAPRAEEEP